MVWSKNIKNLKENQYVVTKTKKTLVFFNTEVRNPDNVPKKPMFLLKKFGKCNTLPKKQKKPKFLAL